MSYEFMLAAAGYPQRCAIPATNGYQGSLTHLNSVMLLAYSPSYHGLQFNAGAWFALYFAGVQRTRGGDDSIWTHSVQGDASIIVFA